MRKAIFFIALLAGVMGAITSCYYENPPEPSPLKAEDVSFRGHVLPILVEDCTEPECHDGTKKPDLREPYAYTSLKVGGYCNQVFPGDSKLYNAITDGVGGLTMPPTSPLTDLEKQIILAWITKGAPND